MQIDQFRLFPSPSNTMKHSVACACVSTFRKVRITDSVQSQIKCLDAEDPRSFKSRGRAKGRKDDGGRQRERRRGERERNLHVKQDKSLCFYPFNVVAPASHWLINETQEGSSGTKECQPKAFDPLTFIHCAPAKNTIESDPCLHAFNGPRRALLTVLWLSEGQSGKCAAMPWKPAGTFFRHPPKTHASPCTWQ